MDPGARSRSTPVEPDIAHPWPLPRILLGLATFLSLILSAVQATAGPLEDAVDRIENKVEKIINNTDGVQELVGNVKGVTSGFQPGVFDDLRDALGEAQDLLAFLKELREEAGSPGDHPDLAVLMGAVEDMIGVLVDDPSFQLGVLTKLLGVLPDPVLAVAGQAVSRAGIDNDSVAEVQQAASDLAVVKEVLAQFDADQDLAFASRDVQYAAAPVLENGTRCAVINERRFVVGQAARFLRRWSIRFRIIGEAMNTPKELIRNEKRAGIHGYAGITVDTDAAGTIGSLLRAAAVVLMEYANSAFARLDQCELLWYEKQIADNADLIRVMLDGNVCQGGAANPPVP